MDWQRTLLIFGMGMIAWLLVIQWNQFQENQPQTESSYSQVEIDRSENLDMAGLKERAYAGQVEGDLPQLESMPTLEVTPTPHRMTGAVIAGSSRRAVGRDRHRPRGPIRRGRPRPTPCSTPRAGLRGRRRRRVRRG